MYDLPEWAQWLSAFGPLILTTALVGVTWHYATQVKKQVIRGEKLDDPELLVHMSPLRHGAAGSPTSEKYRCSMTYTAILLNPGLTPIVITDIEEIASGGVHPSSSELKVDGRFSVHSQVSELPRGLAQRDFVFWTRILQTQHEEELEVVQQGHYRVEATWSYCVGDKNKKKTCVTTTQGLVEDNKRGDV